MFQNTYRERGSGKSSSVSSTLSPTLQAKARPQKLRASCDSCYLAKIKCTKEMPSCVRCLNHSEKCNYSPSQRTGKPKRLHERESGRSEGTDESGQTSALSRRSIANASIQTRPLSWDMDTGNRDFGSGVEMTEDFSKHWRNLFPVVENAGGTFMDETQAKSFTISQGILPTIIEPALDCTSGDYITDQPLFTSFTSLLEHASSSQSVIAPRGSPGGALAQNRKSPLLPGSNSAMFQSEFTQSHPKLQTCIQPEIMPTTAPACTCTTSTFEILYSLHTSTNYPLTFPQVLSTNSTAIADVSHLFLCSCSLEFPSVLQLAAIMTKILSSYRNIASSSASTTPSTNNNTTITMGGYTLETGVDECHIKMQVVLGELKKVEGLLGGFQEKFCKIGRKGEQRIHAELDIYMRRRLRDIVEGVQRDLMPRYDGV